MPGSALSYVLIKKFEREPHMVPCGTPQITQKTIYGVASV